MKTSAEYIEAGATILKGRMAWESTAHSVLYGGAKRAAESRNPFGLETQVEAGGATYQEGSPDSVGVTQTKSGDPKNAYRWYVLVLLTAVLTLNFLDRGLMILLLESIKADLRVSDTQLGFLTGIAFGSFYALAGLPIALKADRSNRVLVVAATISAWGVTLMALMAVRTFYQLVIGRVMAAIGEAGCLPATYSLVGDYFKTPTERTRAMGVYWLSSPLAALISLMVGGWLSKSFGWRTIFFFMGVPALFAALLVKCTVAEPRGVTARGQPRHSIGQVAMSLWRQVAARNLAAGIILLCATGAGLGPWYAAFLIRSHGMTTGNLGVALGLIFGVGGILGVLAGSYLATRYSRGEASQMKLTAAAVTLLVPACAGFLLCPTAVTALCFLVPVTVLTNFFFGPAFSLMQRLVAEETRATTLALVMALANLIGMGLAPQTVGALSDLLRPVVGLNSLRYAMLGISLLGLWSAYHFYRVGQVLQLERPLSVSTSATTDSGTAQ